MKLYRVFVVLVCKCMLFVIVVFWIVMLVIVGLVSGVVEVLNLLLLDLKVLLLFLEF